MTSPTSSHRRHGDQARTVATVADVSPSRDRRLFVGGERLRVTVDAPPSGGGDKFEPQTAAEARDLLLPMVRSVVEGASGLPPELRGERVYFEARLLPNYLAASHFPDVLLSRIGAVPVGSRADIGTYSTKSKAKETGTRRLVLAADDEGLRLLAALIDGPGASRSEQQAFTEITPWPRSKGSNDRSISTGSAMKAKMAVLGMSPRSDRTASGMGDSELPNSSPLVLDASALPRGIYLARHSGRLPKWPSLRVRRIGQLASAAATNCVLPSESSSGDGDRRCPRRNACERRTGCTRR